MMRQRGLVPDKTKKDGICESRWVLKGTTVADKKAAKVDRIVDIFQRFAIKASRKYRSRKVYAEMMAQYYINRASNPRFQWNTPNWGDAMYEAEQAEIYQIVRLPTDKWHALCRGKIESYKKVGRDILPLLRWFQYIDEKRLARANALREAEIDMVELERILRG